MAPMAKAHAERGEEFPWPSSREEAFRIDGAAHSGPSTDAEYRIARRRGGGGIGGGSDKPRLKRGKVAPQSKSSTSFLKPFRGLLVTIGNLSFVGILRTALLINVLLCIFVGFKRFFSLIYRRIFKRIAMGEVVKARRVGDEVFRPIVGFRDRRGRVRHFMADFTTDYDPTGCRVEVEMKKGKPRVADARPGLFRELLRLLAPWVVGYACLIGSILMQQYSYSG